MWTNPLTVQVARSGIFSAALIYAENARLTVNEELHDVIADLNLNLNLNRNLEFRNPTEMGLGNVPAIDDLNAIKDVALNSVSPKTVRSVYRKTVSMEAQAMDHVLKNLRSAAIRGMQTIRVRVKVRHRVSDRFRH